MLRASVGGSTPCLSLRGDSGGLAFPSVLLVGAPAECTPLSPGLEVVRGGWPARRLGWPVAVSGRAAQMGPPECRSRRRLWGRSRIANAGFECV